MTQIIHLYIEGHKKLRNKEYIMKFNVDNVIKAKQGNKEAFADLYEEVNKDLYRIACYTLANVEDAKDAVSETAIAAFLGIKSLRDPERFGTWIMKILSNKCKSKIREYAYNNTVNLDSVPEVEALSKDMELRVDLLSALATLDYETKMIVLLTVFSGYKSSEIGHIFGLGGSKVRSRYRRATKKLSKILEGNS